MIKVSRKYLFLGIVVFYVCILQQMELVLAPQVYGQTFATVAGPTSTPDCAKKCSDNGCDLKTNGCPAAKPKFKTFPLGTVFRKCCCPATPTPTPPLPCNQVCSGSQTTTGINCCIDNPLYSGGHVAPCNAGEDPLNCGHCMGGTGCCCVKKTTPPAPTPTATPAPPGTTPTATPSFNDICQCKIFVDYECQSCTTGGCKEGKACTICKTEEPDAEHKSDCFCCPGDTHCPESTPATEPK